MSSSEKDIFFPLHVPLNIALYLGFTKIQGIYLLHPNALKNIKKTLVRDKAVQKAHFF